MDCRLPCLSIPTIRNNPSLYKPAIFNSFAFYIQCIRSIRINSNGEFGTSCIVLKQSFLLYTLEICLEERHYILSPLIRNSHGKHSHNFDSEQFRIMSPYNDQIFSLIILLFPHCNMIYFLRIHGTLRNPVDTYAVDKDVWHITIHLFLNINLL